MPPTRVLLIDDNPADVTLLRILWQNDYPGLELAWVDTIPRALARLEQVGADIVVLDVSLPGQSWPGSLARLRQAFPAVPVVVLSGHADAKYRDTALALGASDYLVKGLDTCGQLAMVVSQVAKKGETV